jgi:L-rhamnose isomerase
MTNQSQVIAVLDRLKIETPSWAYGNSGTRFKVFAQAGVPRDPFEKIADAAGMHNYTGYIGGPDNRMVVGYFEVESVEKMNAYLSKSEVNTEWSKIITPLMETGGDVSNGSMEFMRPIWRIE